MTRSKAPAREPFDYDDQLRRMRRMMEMIIPHVNRKDLHYGSSWRKRGGPGAFFTIVRKLDRFEEAAFKEGYDIFGLFENDARKESILDDCADIIGYMLVLMDYAMHMGYITQEDVRKMCEQSQTPRLVNPLDAIRKDLRGAPPRIAEPRGYDPEQDDPIEGEGKEGPAR